MKTLPRRVLRRSKHFALLVLLLFAGYLTAGRLLMPLLTTQKAAIESNLSRALGMPVTIASLQGAWFRFSPVIELRSLQMGTATTGLHSIGHGQVALDIYASLFEGHPVISRLSLEDLSLTLKEVRPGSWTLAGLADTGGSLDSLFDFWLQTKEFTLKDGELHLQRFNGEQVALHSAFLNLQNRDVHHELQLQLRTDDKNPPSHLILQLDGDPRGTFFSKLWLDTEQVNWLSLLKSELPASWQWQQLQGRAQVWAQLDSDGIKDIKLALSGLAVEAKHSDGVHVLALQQGQVQVFAKPKYSNATEAPAWDVHLQRAYFDWQNTPWEIANIALSNQPTTLKRWTLTTNSLDVSLLQQLVTTVVPMPAAGHEALVTLAPQGFLRNLRLSAALDESDPQVFLLQANLQDVAVQAWRETPSGSGVQGYIEANLQGGFVELDSKDFTLHLPLLFEDAWHFDKANARVSWRASPEFVQVQSTMIDVANAQLEGRVRFALTDTRNAEGHWLNDFMLQVGVEKMQVATIPAFLPTLSKMESTNAWLKAALQGGDAVDSGFVLHTLGGSGLSALGTTAADSAQVVAWYRLQAGTLQFLQEWPQLSNIDAAVVQRNNEIEIVVPRATIAGINLTDATARISAGEDESSVLAIQATSTTSAALGLNLLKETPIHNSLGSFLDSWQASGEIGLEVGIGVDLGHNPKPPFIQVLTKTNNTQLNLADLDLHFDDISGDIHYVSTAGLSAQKIQATLFSQPLNASIRTDMTANSAPTTVIEGDGHTPITELYNWSHQSAFVKALLGYTTGEIDYHVRLAVEPPKLGDEKVTRLQISSNLVGLQSKLPKPLNKAATELSPLVLELAFQPPLQTLSLHYQDWLIGELFLDAQGIQRGQLSVGERNRNFTVRQADSSEAGVLVTGELASFDLPAWQAVASQLNNSAGEGRTAADYLRLIEVNVGELMLPGISLNAAKVLVQHPMDTWHINVQNEVLKGELQLPDNSNKPWELTFDYLRFPARKPKGPLNPQAVEEEPDPLQEVEPAKLPAFDFVARELSVGDQNLGAFSFQFRPNTHGASIANFKMTSVDSSITDSAQTLGANIDWQYKNGVHHTSFSGLFAAGDLAKVLPAWGNDTNVVSKSASFDSQLTWSGSPLYFSLKRASGKVDLKIGEGRFVDISSGSSRIFGALNFDALIRRLKLDFSDLFAKGYSFDSINGLLSFTDGVVTTTTPLKIDSPSSGLSIQGRINLRDETIAADMQVQIPLGQNLSVVAGLLGAWPIAVSTYLASKILQNQVDDFTTVVYRLEGPWSAPTAGFEPPKNEAAAEKLKVR